MWENDDCSLGIEEKKYSGKGKPEENFGYNVEK